METGQRRTNEGEDSENPPRLAQAETCANQGSNQEIEVLDELKHGIEISIRYHNRRRSFFDSAHITATALTLVSGSGAAVAILSSLSSWIAAVFGLAVVAITVLDLLVQCTQKSRIHHDLQRRYIDLKRAIVQGEANQKNLKKWQAVALSIDADEPPQKRILTALVHNEVCRKIGAPDSELVKIGWDQALAANCFDFRPGSLKQ